MIDKIDINVPVGMQSNYNFYPKDVVKKAVEKYNLENSDKEFRLKLSEDNSSIILHSNTKK